MHSTSGQGQHYFPFKNNLKYLSITDTALTCKYTEMLGLETNIEILRKIEAITSPVAQIFISAW